MRASPFVRCSDLLATDGSHMGQRAASELRRRPPSSRHLEHRLSECMAAQSTQAVIERRRGSVVLRATVLNGNIQQFAGESEFVAAGAEARVAWKRRSQARWKRGDGTMTTANAGRSKHCQCCCDPAHVPCRTHAWLYIVFLMGRTQGAKVARCFCFEMEECPAYVPSVNLPYNIRDGNSFIKSIVEELCTMESEIHEFSLSLTCEVSIL